MIVSPRISTTYESMLSCGQLLLNPNSGHMSKLAKLGKKTYPLTLSSKGHKHETGSSLIVKWEIHLLIVCQLSSSSYSDWFGSDRTGGIVIPNPPHQPVEVASISMM